MKLISLLLFMVPFILLSQIDGTVPIRGDYLWMSATEVSNENYGVFLAAISEKERLKNMPNSDLWLFHNYMKPLAKQYFTHPAYQKYPVVNITHSQATAYCHWLTKSINAQFPNQDVCVRLPTQKEWEDAAKAGKPFAMYPWGTRSMRVTEGKNQGDFQANFVMGKGVSMLDGATITAPVCSYWPNDFGLYNMSGNVSEMIDQEGIVKGGSWKNRADWLRIEKQQFVNGASPEVGFRYVVEVIDLKKEEENQTRYGYKKKFFRKYFAKVNDTLFMGKFEVTNELFQSFLNRLCGDSTQHPQVANSNWNDLFPYSDFWAQNYASHPKYNDYPVVNVSYKAASQFCSMLSWEYEKAYGEKVKIRLPTEQEWEIAAQGKLQSAKYPWGGNYLRNSKGNYLANFNPKMSEEENVIGSDTLSLGHFFQGYFTDLHDFDGEAVLAPVDSYFPNNYGIYNIAGNAAEMVLDSSFTKGGSWKSSSSFLHIKSKEEWDGKANPFTGFRVVMVKPKNK